MMQTAVRYADELWLFLRQEIFTPPPTATAIGDWFWAQLQKGMSFTSLAFLLFFPVCLLLYYAVPKRAQNVWLLLCSYFFYYFATTSGGNPHPQALAVLAGLTLVTYLVALGIDHLQRKALRVLLLVLGIIAHIGMLCYVKYTGFFLSLLNSWFSLRLTLQPAFETVWMVGLSFYTLIAVGYLTDVYRQNSPAEKKPIKCALFLSFFPQVVSGPIARTDNLLHQMNHAHRFDYNGVREGLREMLWGFFKKMVISENAAAILKFAFSDPGKYNGFQLVFSALLYAVQLYADFSGYSNIAIGAARCLGFQLPANFNRPYGARSIGEFWDRWHISLSRWLRDYVYIPLGGSRCNLARTCLNIFLVFFVSGLWHGAGLTFVAWGALHGLYNLLSRLTRTPRSWVADKLHLAKIPLVHGFFQRLYTFFIVSFAWVFFRSESLQSALLFLSRIPVAFGATLFYAATRLKALNDIGFSANNGIALLVCIAGMFLLEAAQRRRPLPESFGKVPLPLRWAGYYVLLLCILLFGVFDSTPFIYGQF
ncbi:MAG: MBOAT family protein [Pygmaiobacter sp.]|nr:MBOAT family protein [Pygmaiobacter sp.]